MHHIIIIGTVPPCPRCSLLTELVTEMTESLGLDASITHISYISEEANEIAEKEGLKPGTAKDVAKIKGKDINLQQMPKVSELPAPDFIKSLKPELKRLESLFREVHILDNWLRTFEHQAKDAGIMMTPVLIINGEVKYNGSVPDLPLIEKLLNELK